MEYWVQKDIITIVPVFQDYQDIMTFNTITGSQTYRSSSYIQGTSKDIQVSSKDIRDYWCPLKTYRCPLKTYRL